MSVWVGEKREALDEKPWRQHVAASFGAPKLGHPLQFAARDCSSGTYQIPSAIVRSNVGVWSLWFASQPLPAGLASYGVVKILELTAAVFRP